MRARVKTKAEASSCFFWFRRQVVKALREVLYTNNSFELYTRSIKQRRTGKENKESGTIPLFLFFCIRHYNKTWQLSKHSAFFSGCKPNIPNFEGLPVGSSWLRKRGIIQRYGADCKT